MSEPSAAAALPGAADSRAVLAALLGALTIAFSAVLVALADVAPAAAAAWRCLYAVPFLVLLAWREQRRLGPRAPGQRRFALLAGAFLGIDLVVWHQAIADVGAGLATVLGNLQVVVVPFVAWLVLREAPGARIVAALPLALGGIVLISGVLEDGAYGDEPVRGAVLGALTGFAYAGFILLLRHGSRDAHRPAGPLLDATAVAGVEAMVIAVVLGTGDLVPAWPSAGWLALLAVSSGVFGWMLIASSLPRLPAAVGSVLLTLQPVGSVALGVLLLGEEPTGLQLAGAALVLAGLLAVARRG